MASAARPRGTGSLYERHGKWYGKWWIEGRQIQRRIGPRSGSGALSRTLAQQRLRELMVETGRASDGARLTVAEAGEQYISYLERVKQRKPSTVQDYRIIVRLHLGPHFGRRPLDRITVGDVQSYIDTKIARLARQTVVNQVNLLHGIFQFAVRRGLAGSNPVAKADKPPKAGRVTDLRFLSADELSRLLAHGPDGPFAGTDRAIYAAAAMAGLRQGELIALQWSDVDLKQMQVRVRRSFTRGILTTPKSRSGSRVVPLAAPLRTVLERHRVETPWSDREDLVFPHPVTGSYLDASRLRRRFVTALSRAGVRSVRFHDLRHTYGTLMANAGTPLRVLQEWMGHASYVTTEIYADYAPDESRARVWTELAFGAGTEPGPETRDPEHNSDALDGATRA